MYNTVMGFIYNFGTIIIIYTIYFFLFWKWKGKRISKREAEIDIGVYESEKVKKVKESYERFMEHYGKVLSKDSEWIEKGKMYDREKVLREFYEGNYKKHVLYVESLENRIEYLENQLEKNSRLGG